jgi:hypothetical protein
MEVCSFCRMVGFEWSHTHGIQTAFLSFMAIWQHAAPVYPDWKFRDMLMIQAESSREKFPLNAICVRAESDLDLHVLWVKRVTCCQRSVH